MFKTEIIGRLVSDPQYTNTNNRPMLVFDVMANNGYTDSNGQWQEQLNRVRITKFGPGVPKLHSLGIYKKGHLIHATCISNNSSYTNSSGQVVYTTNHVINNIERLSRTYAEMRADEEFRYDNSPLNTNFNQQTELPLETTSVQNDDMPF